jgi:hypothetical protein
MSSSDGRYLQWTQRQGKACRWEKLLLKEDDMGDIAHRSLGDRVWN